MIRRPFLQAECDRFKRLRENGFSLTACGEILKRQRRVLGMVEARGYTPTPRKEHPLPGDFSAMAARMTVSQLRKHYRVTHYVLIEWIAQVGREKKKPGRSKPELLRPCPPDFVEQHAKLNWKSLLKHYGAGPSTIRRWRKECGVASPRKPFGPKRPPKPANDRSWIERYQPTPDYLKLRSQLIDADNRRAAL